MIHKPMQKTDFSTVDPETIRFWGRLLYQTMAKHRYENPVDRNMRRMIPEEV